MKLLIPLSALLKITIIVFSLIPKNLQGQNLTLDIFKTTLRVSGVSMSDSTGISTGTVFFVWRKHRESSRPIVFLVTAAHVLEGIKGEFATLHLRKKNGTSLVPYSDNFRIRRGDKKLWMKHPIHDVAVMLAPADILNASEEVVTMPATVLSDEKNYNNLELEPGQSVNILGFPKGLSGNAIGYPLLRSGIIASYPIYPLRENPLVFLDIEVFGGNSGGPAFSIRTQRIKENIADFTHGYQRIIGLVTVQVASYGERLVLAGYVPSPFILETIDMLYK